MILIHKNLEYVQKVYKHLMIVPQQPKTFNKNYSFRKHKKWKRQLKQKDHTVFDDILKISSAIKLIGMFPLIYDDTNLTFLLPKKSFLVAIAVSVFFLACDIFVLIEYVFRLTDLFQHLLLTMAHFSLHYVLRHVQILNEGLKVMFLADRVLKERGMTVKFRVIVSYQVIIIVAILGLLSIRLSYYNTVVNWILALLFYWPSLTLTFYVHHIAGIVSVLNFRFSCINKMLKNNSRYLNNASKSMIFQDRLRFPKKRTIFLGGVIQDLALCHNLLCTAGDKLNQVLGVSFLTISGYCFWLLLSESLNLYIEITAAVLDIKSVLVKSAWCVIAFVMFWQISHECEVSTRKAKEFNNLLYQLMIDDKTNEILNNQKLRLHISLKRDVVFTACGFFTLDYALIHSMIASATTYLVILIQFGQPNETPAQSSATETVSSSNGTVTPFPMLAQSTFS